MPTLGLAMITQNEEMHIPASLAQFYHIVDEMVVVDGGSTDATVLWAERMGARVIRRPFKNDFADQKNFAIEQLTTDWIYFHDPDERLEPTLVSLIAQLIRKEGQKNLAQLGILPFNEREFDCFGIARRNYIDGIQDEHYPDYQYRLFKNYCRFSGKVHEKLMGYRNRTEVDYTRPLGARPNADLFKLKVEDPFTLSRFNILHYKSSLKQENQHALYRKIQKQEELERS